MPASSRLRPPRRVPSISAPVLGSLPDCVATFVAAVLAAAAGVIVELLIGMITVSVPWFSSLPPRSGKSTVSSPGLMGVPGMVPPSPGVSSVGSSVLSSGSVGVVSVGGVTTGGTSAFLTLRTNVSEVELPASSKTTIVLVPSTAPNTPGLTLLTSLHGLLTRSLTLPFSSTRSMFFASDSLKLIDS